MTTPAKLIAIMRKEVGTKEVPGTGNNPRIVAYKQVIKGDPVNDPDSVPWCSDFQAWAVNEAGLPVPKTITAAARSWLTYGISVLPSQALPGDIAVFSRGSSPTAGHVGTISKVLPNGNFMLLQGNISNAVVESEYSVTNLLGVRRPPWQAEAPAPPKPRPQPDEPAPEITEKDVKQTGIGAAVLAALAVIVGVIGRAFGWW